MNQEPRIKRANRAREFGNKFLLLLAFAMQEGYVCMTSKSAKFGAVGVYNEECIGGWVGGERGLRWSGKVASGG